MPMRALPEENRLNAIAMLQHGRSTCEVPKLLGISRSTCSRIHEERVPHVELSRGGHPSSITPTKQRACVRAITIGGLNNVVDMRNALSEHFNVVVSINAARHALHDAGLESLKKQKKSLLTTNNMR